MVITELLEPILFVIMPLLSFLLPIRPMLFAKLLLKLRFTPFRRPERLHESANLLCVPDYHGAGDVGLAHLALVLGDQQGMQGHGSLFAQRLTCFGQRLRIGPVS